MKNKNQTITYLHQDTDLLIVNKPPFLLAIPDRWDKELPNVLTKVREKHEGAFVVHRLDKETSGLICLAKNAAAHKHLSKQFEKRTVDKKYLVLVDGNSFPERGEINGGIAPHPVKPGKMIISNKGKESLTEYRLLEQFNQFALVEATIKTGRMHQIRVHFESIGYPLAIDKVYGRRESMDYTDIKKKKLKYSRTQEAPRPLMSRSSLHAWKLSLDHPTSGERLEFEAELPKDFRAVVNQLRKWG